MCLSRDIIKLPNIVALYYTTYFMSFAHIALFIALCFNGTGNAEELFKVRKNTWNFQARRGYSYVSTRYTYNFPAIRPKNIYRIIQHARKLAFTQCISRLFLIQITSFLQAIYSSNVAKNSISFIIFKLLYVSCPCSKFIYKSLHDHTTYSLAFTYNPADTSLHIFSTNLKNSSTALYAIILLYKQYHSVLQFYEKAYINIVTKRVIVVHYAEFQLCVNIIDKILKDTQIT